MATAKILSSSGKEAGSADLADALFAAPVNEALLHQAVVRQQAGARIGTAATLTRGMVTGGGRKPWRQKGTGRARQGSRVAPHWRGGGAVFGPHPRDYAQQMPAKMRRAALRSALSARQAEGALRIVEGFDLPEIRTKGFLEHLVAWDAQGRVLLVLPARDEVVERSCANLREVRVILADSLNVVDVLDADTIVFTSDALARAQEVYA